MQSEKIRSETNVTIETGVFAHRKGKIISTININFVTINRKNCSHTGEIYFPGQVVISTIFTNSVF